MIRIEIKGVYTLNEALEVLRFLQTEETTDGVSFSLSDGECETVALSGVYNDYVLVFNKKDLITNIKVGIKNGGFKKMKKDLNDVNVLWDELLDQELFTYDELKILTDVNGYNIITLKRALYVRYGYRDLEQMMEE